MNLTVDIGNTRCKLSVFSGNEIIDTQVFNTLKPENLSDLVDKYNIDRAIICSVSVNNNGVEQLLKQYVNRVVLFDSSTPVPVKNAYATPETLGLDRLAAVVGAWSLKEGSPSLIIDAGTAITYDFLTSEGIYIGGNIAPGATLRLRSLHEHTDRLPLVSLDERRRNSLLADNTRSAILGGVISGIAFEIEGYIKSLTEKYPSLEVFLTGGDAIFFEKQIKSSIFVVPNLTAVGLNKILEYNS